MKIARCCLSKKLQINDRLRLQHRVVTKLRQLALNKCFAKVLLKFFTRFRFRSKSVRKAFVMRSVDISDFGLLYPNDNLAVIGIPSDCHNGKPDSRGDRNETFLLFVSYHHQVCLNFSLDTGKCKIKHLFILR